MFIFYVSVPLLYIEYLNKRTVLEAKIFGVFLAHLWLHTSKVSLKSVTSIEQVGSHFDRLYQASKSGYFLMARSGPYRAKYCSGSPGPARPDTAYQYTSFKKYSRDGSQ
jgi:hypothetical protein